MNSAILRLAQYNGGVFGDRIIAANPSPLTTVADVNAYVEAAVLLDERLEG